MARVGRFGRSTTGTSNLSSFINSLVQQNRALNERALINAFQDQTMYAGGVPNSGDIEAYVNAQIEGLDPNSPQYAYYMNMLENAKRMERDRAVSSARQSLGAAGSDGYDDFYSQISDMLSNEDLSAEERQNLEALLSEETQSFVNIVASEYTAGITSFDELIARTDVAIGRLEGQNQENALLTRASSIVSRETASLNTGAIDVAAFRAMTDAAMRGVTPGSAAAFDINVGIQAAIWNKEKDDLDVALARSKNKGYSSQIKANKNYIEWAQGQLAELKARGLAESDFADQVKIQIADRRADLNAAQVAAYNVGYNNRKNTVTSIEKQINNLMKQVPLYVGGEKKSFTIDDIFASDINDAIGAAAQVIRYLDLDPTLRAQYDTLMEEYRGATSDFYQYASANGAGGEAQAYKARSKQVRSMTGLDTAMEDYDDARDIRLDLVAKANGNDSSINEINRQWSDFLAGKQTTYFGKGIATPTDAFTAALVNNEKQLYDAYASGVPVKGLGATMMGYYERDTQLPEGYNGTVEDFEAEQVAISAANAKGLADGTMMLGRDANGIPATVPARPADQSRGEYTFMVTDERGVPRAKIEQGIPVVGVERGVAGKTWGFYYPDQKVWVAADDGTIYKTPPFAPANGGRIETDADGKPRVRVDMQTGTITPGGTGNDARWAPVESQPTNGAGQPTEPKTITPAEAVFGKKITVSAGFTPAGIGTTGAVKAIMDNVPADDRKQFEEAFVLYNQGQKLYQEFRAGERDMNLGTNSEAVKLFDTFLGSKSEVNNQQLRKEVLVVRNNQPEWRTIQYRDAYFEREPGVFVRKEAATEVDSFGRKMDEGSQTFPAIIDVRSVKNDPAVKPFIGSVITPETPLKSASPTVDYFFRKVGSRAYEGDTVAEGRATMLAAQQAGMTTTPRTSTTTSLPGYANPNYGGVSTRTGTSATSLGVSTPLTMAIPKFTAPTMPVASAARAAGLGVSAGDTQAELLGQLRALSVPGFSTPSVGGVTPKLGVGTGTAPRSTMIKL